jgi:hypothetical protein
MNLLVFVLTFLLFIGPVIMAVMGWPLYGFVEKSKVLYLYPSFYILTVVTFYFYFQKRLTDKKFKFAILIILVTFSWYFVDKILARE